MGTTQDSSVAVNQFLDHFQQSAQKTTERIGKLESFGVVGPTYYSVVIGDVIVSDTAGESTLFSVLIPKGILGDNNILPYKFVLSFINHTAAATTVDFKLYFAAQLAFHIPAAPVQTGDEIIAHIEGHLWNDASSQKQAGLAEMIIGQPRDVFSAVDPSLRAWTESLLNVDSTVDQLLTLTVTHTAATNLFTTKAKMFFVYFPIIRS